jgi:arylsulfatase A-like enzyme
MVGRLIRGAGDGRARKESSRRPRNLLVAGLATLLLAGVGIVALAIGDPSPPTPPNILFIITDDQRADGTMDVMPTTVQWFQNGGTKFTRAFATTTSCCPSRASIFSGRYVHNHGVRSNESATYLDQRYTLQHYLKQDGYATALYGKYFNAWNLLHNPADFDYWSIFSAGYTPIRVNEQGIVKTVTQYATSYISDQAVNFIQNQETNDSQPWFLEIAPTAPHAPFQPDTQYANASVPPFNAPPSYYEADRSDKPPRYQNRDDSATTLQTDRTQQLRTLMSVDDMVNRVFQTLEATGEASDTLAIFMSDNGYLWGEHGLEGKGEPYDESVRVPLFMRWPNHVASGATDSRLVANIDLAPTALDAAGVTPTLPMDGRSLLNQGYSRSHLLLDFYQDGPFGRKRDWASVRTPNGEYNEYYTRSPGEQNVSFREYYDLSADPYELTNLLNDGNSGNDPATGTLSSEIRQDLECSGSSCP